MLFWSANRFFVLVKSNFVEFFSLYSLHWVIICNWISISFVLHFLWIKSKHRMKLIRSKNLHEQIDSEDLSNFALTWLRWIYSSIETPCLRPKGSQRSLHSHWHNHVNFSFAIFAISLILLRSFLFLLSSSSCSVPAISYMYSICEKNWQIELRLCQVMILVHEIEKRNTPRPWGRSRCSENMFVILDPGWFGCYKLGMSFVA